MGRDHKQKTRYVVGKAKKQNQIRRGEREGWGSHAILCRCLGVGIQSEA